MKITRHSENNITIDGEFLTEIFRKNEKDFFIFADGVKNLNELGITFNQFHLIGSKAKIFGSYWNINGVFYRFISETNSGFLFLKPDNKTVIYFQPERIEKELNK